VVFLFRCSQCFLSLSCWRCWKEPYKGSNYTKKDIEKQHGFVSVRIAKLFYICRIWCVFQDEMYWSASVISCFIGL
jgi:hypothetical protein